MNICIAIAGGHGSCGKTSLATLLLRGPCSRFAAVKVTPTGEFPEIVVAEERISQPGKDSWRMRQAGGDPVLWIRTPRYRFAETWARAEPLLEGAPGIIVEGNSAVDFVNPALVLFVLDFSRPAKAGTHRLLSKADAWVVNCRGGFPSRLDRQCVEESVVRGSGKGSGPVFFVDLAKGGHDTEGLVTFVRQRLGATATAGGSL